MRFLGLVESNITSKPEDSHNGRKFTLFSQQIVNDGGGGNGDEARYNLATRVMANGVEVIVADGKTTLPGDFFRILTNKHYIKPLTLAPSTLNNVMFMTLGNQVSLPNIYWINSVIIFHNFLD